MRFRLSVSECILTSEGCRRQDQAHIDTSHHKHWELHNPILDIRYPVPDSVGHGEMRARRLLGD